MKKFVLTALTVLTCGAVYALPVMNPVDASLYTNNLWFDGSGYDSCDPCDPCSSWCDWFNLRLGFYGDYVFDRHLETKGKLINGAPDIQKTQLSTNAGLAVLNICNWLDIYGLVGVSNFSIVTPTKSWGVIAAANAFDQSELGFTAGMAYGAGVRATLWSCGCFGIGAEGQYFYANPQLDWYMDYSQGTLTYLTSNRGKKYQEWQVGLGASYIFSTRGNLEFVPYAAVQVAGVDFDLDSTALTYTGGNPTFQPLQQKKTVGWALGMSAVLCDLIGVTVEGRWANEKAVHVNGQLSF